MLQALDPLRPLARRGFVTAPSSLLTGLLAVWHMEESAGNNRVDATGRGNDLVETGGTIASTTGILNNAANFPNNNRYLAVADNADVSWNSGDRSLVLWVKPASLVDYLAFASKFDPTGVSAAVSEFFLLGYANGAVEFDVYGNGNNAVSPTTGTGALVAAQWNLIIASVTKSTGVARVRVNNGTAATATSIPIVGNINTTSQSLKIGDDPSFPGYMLNGPIDEVLLYDRALTSGEESTLWNSGAGKFHPAF